MTALSLHVSTHKKYLIGCIFIKPDVLNYALLLRGVYLWVFKTCKKRTRRTPQTGMRLVRLLVRLAEKSWVEPGLSWA